MSTTIHDSLNGRVELSDLEREIIGSPLFLRLARISQMGLARLVFPGATHSRLSHSIGVAHLVGKLGRSLRLDPEETDKLRLAGLLHDIGQYPLSHCIELAYRIIGDPGGQASDRIFQSTGPLDEEFEPTLLQRVGLASPSAGGAKDKAIGAEILARRTDLRTVLLEAGRSEEYIDEIAGIVAGSTSNSLYHSILDSDYDCDRLDYVRRDARAAGVVYGNIDLDYLIENMDLREDPPGSSNQVVAIHRRKGLGALEHYLLARYHMYSQVIFHKTVRSLELLAKAAFIGLAKEGRVFRHYGEITDAIDTDAYVEFDDTYFLTRLQEYAKEAKGNAELKMVIQRLLDRRPLKLAYEFRILGEGDTDPRYRQALTILTRKPMLDEIAKKSGIPREELVIDLVPGFPLVPVSKEMSTREVMNLVREAAKGTLPSIEAPPLFGEQDEPVTFLFEEEGSLLNYIADRQLLLIRVYTTRDDPEVVKRLHDVIAAELVH
jgi:HD superfamily phosphohydrolase